MDATQKQRLLTFLKKAGLLLALGLGYLVWVRLTGLGIPCLFYQLTGKLCPGCGISRMCMALAALDLPRAFRCNALVMGLLPFALIFGTRHLVRYVRTGSTEIDRLEFILLLAALVLTIAFGILRNLPGFTFLVPG